MVNGRKLVEESFELSIRDVRSRWDNILKIGVNKLRERPDISFWFDEEYTNLFISIGGQEPQKIVWEADGISYAGPYFNCACGYRAKKLYLPPDETEFKCRKCHNLIYELSTISNKSVSGKALYKVNRMIKLANSREKIGKIFYRGGFTKRFRRFLALCDKAGLDNLDAKDLISFIKAHSI